MSQCVALVGLVLLRTTGGSVSTTHPSACLLYVRVLYSTVQYVHQAETRRANQLFPADLLVALRTASLRRSTCLSLFRLYGSAVLVKSLLTHTGHTSSTSTVATGSDRYSAVLDSSKEGAFAGQASQNFS